MFGFIGLVVHIEQDLAGGVGVLPHPEFAINVIPLAVEFVQFIVIQYGGQGRIVLFQRDRIPAFLEGANQEHCHHQGAVDQEFPGQQIHLAVAGSCQGFLDNWMLQWRQTGTGNAFNS